VYGTGAAPSSACARSISRRHQPGDREHPRQRDHRVGQLGRRPGHLLGVRAPSDPGPEPEGRPALARHQVDVVEHPDQAPARIQHRQVAHAVVEHLEQRLGARAVARHRPGGRAHHLRQLRVRPRPGGHHARPDVAVGDDAELVTQIHHGARDPGVDHPPRRVLDRGVRRAHERLSPDQLAHAAPGGRGHRRLRMTGQQAHALVHRAGHEAHGVGALEHRPDRVRRDPVHERVLGRPGHEPERRLLQQRGEAEHLPLAEQIEQAAVDYQLHRAAPDDVREARGLLRAVEDRCPGGVELDLGARGHALERLRVERVERRMPAQEVRYVMHARI
jgi:hypothetical protein